VTVNWIPDCQAGRRVHTCSKNPCLPVRSGGQKMQGGHPALLASLLFSIAWRDTLNHLPVAVRSVHDDGHAQAAADTSPVLLVSKVQHRALGHSVPVLLATTAQLV
jgi:hypothetical protein